MANREMAVAIAKDVIGNLSKLSVIRKGTYLESFPDNISPDDDTQERIEEIAAECTVCALGAILISKIRMFNNVPMADLLGFTDNTISRWCIRPSPFDIRRHLTAIFGIDQLSLIEHAFECWHEGETLCGEFGNQFADPRDRLRAIMQNIVDNGGEFRPEIQNDDAQRQAANREGSD